MSYVIVDIDGTIALKGDRDPFHYHLADADLPNWPVIRTVQALHDAGNRIVFFSGRENVDFETDDDYKAHGRNGTCHDLTVARRLLTNRRPRSTGAHPTREDNTWARTSPRSATATP